MMQHETGTVGDFMTSEPVSVPNTATLREAIDAMVENKVSNLVVTDGASIGLLTEREVLNYLDAFGHFPDRVIGDIMLRQFAKVTPKTPIGEAARIMLSSRTRLLVYEQDRMVGIITTSDLLRGLMKTTGQNHPLDGVMSRNVQALEAGALVRDAIGVMNKKRIGSVIITIDGLHDGVFTERDLLTRILAQGVDISQQIAGLYSPFLITARIGIKGRDAAALMLNNTIKRIPLTEKGRVVAIVTARDIVEAFVSGQT